MISAFGVDHLSKSFVPGAGFSPTKGLKGYKRAVDLTSAERSAIKNNPTAAKIRAGGGREKMARRRQAAGKNRTDIWPGTKTPKGKLTKVIPSMREGSGMPSMLQAHAQPNGRGGGTVHFYHDTQNVGPTLRHEKAHITPKRNPVRFQERYLNETRRGREEGRADFTAHGKQTTGQYPGGDDFQRGYSEVQGKMAAGKFKRNLKKSLPSALRNAKKTPGFSKFNPSYQDKSRAAQTMQALHSSHINGKAASKWLKTGSPQSTGLNTASGTMTAGKKNKARYRELVELQSKTPRKRKLP